MSQAPTRPPDRPGPTQWRHGRVVLAAMVLALVAGVTAGSRAGTTLIVSQPLTDPDAVIALASHEWERLPVAAELAIESPRAQIWLTLPLHVGRHNCFRCAERVAWLDRAGVDSGRVTVLPDRVTNTRDEAAAAAAFAREHPVHRLVVVTSPYHARRSLATFRRLFERSGATTEIGIVTPTAGVTPARWWRRRYDREYVAYEWAAIGYYTVRYGVSPVL